MCFLTAASLTRAGSELPTSCIGKATASGLIWLIARCCCPRLNLLLLSPPQPSSGATVNVGVDPSKCIITKLKLDKDRRALLDRKSAAKTADKGKGKFTEQEVQAMQQVD